MLLYMAATRTQVYLTASQRRRLDQRRRAEGKSLAQVVRDAIDAYLDQPAGDPETALRASFGASPGLDVPPRDEWDRG
jgi:hypothetical protein